MLLLSLLLVPLLSAVLIGAWPGLVKPCLNRIALSLAVIPVLLVGVIGFHGGASWSLPWLPDAGIHLSFHADGTSWMFLLLTSLITLFSMVVSAKLNIGDRAYFALMLVMESMLFGVFTATHFIPWFLCWEMTLIPAYLLIRLWGGRNASRAARRFFIITLAGGVCMLLGFLALQLSVGTMDFALLGKLAAQKELAASLGKTFAITGLGGHALLTTVAVSVLLGLAVKIPIVPFHAWLPDAYAEAPTPITMLLTGLLSKMGVYGLLRVFLPLFPEVFATLAPWLVGLSVATVLLGAVAALAQKDLKRILAYSSVNHLGYCVLAVAAVVTSQTDRVAMASAISGLVLQAFNHGIIASAMFFGIGILESRSGGLRGLKDFGGLRARMPVFAGLLGITMFASLGLPGLSGFVGEFLIFNGAFGLVPWAAAISVIGLLLTAVFFLRIIRKVFHGPLGDNASKWTDLTATERWIFAPAIALIVMLGFFPHLLLQIINSDTLRLIELLSPIP
ncbi:MAG: NADH-quinone oxidoreductase subunit M [Gloeobacteraceae cyanobacterium ES-bin-144]|nr:NADH-quinone oxidoreductase subunit M [Verrucomicrobiales bacterium]